MQLAMAKLIVSLIKRGRLKGLKMLVKQGSNKGKSVDSMVKKAYKTLAGSKKSKLRPLEQGSFAPKGTFTDKFYTEGRNLTDDFGKTDWQVFDDLVEMHPPRSQDNLNKITSWLGPKFKEGNLDIF